jgi:hypothetical protein
MSSESFNMIEAIVWFLLGVGCFISARLRRAGYKRKLLILAGLNFFIFSFTDLYETGTGAWWDPSWLLALKAFCIAVFIVLYAFCRRAPK